MNVAVTGGAGFLGRHVTAQLLDAGHTVSAFDVARQDVVWPGYGGMLDIRQKVSAAFFHDVDVVIHLAAESNTQRSVAEIPRTTHLNCWGTVNVLEAALKAGVRRVVLASSTLLSSIQIENRVISTGDTEEPYYQVVDEYSPIAPLASYHPYLTTKLFTEMIARDYEAQFGLEATVFRLGIMYGPRMTPGVVAHEFITRGLQNEPLKVHGSGHQWRQYTYVEDVARAFVQLVDGLEGEEDRTSGETYNVCGRDQVTILRMAEVVSALCGGVPIVHTEMRPGIDIDVKYCLAEKAWGDLGWVAETSLEDGMAKTVDWYEKEQEL